MKQPPVRADAPPISPAIHLEFIRTVAETDGGTRGQDVEAFHRALFLHQHGHDLARFREQRRVSEDRLVDLEARLGRVRQRLAGAGPFVPVLEDGRPDTQPNAPWNFWDRTMFVAAAAAIVCLLVFGVLNVSFNLLESGLVTFAEHPYRAYFWAALLPVGALAVKVGWDLLRGLRQRDIYLWTCLALGVAGVLVWVAAYASIYPALSRTAAEQIGSLSVTDQGSSTDDSFGQLTSGGAKRIDMLLVSAQALAEICLSAVLGIYLTQLYAKHRPVRLAPDPAYTQFDAERRRLEAGVSQERLALADAAGGEARLENQLAVFVKYARSLFEREAALRRDPTHQKRRLLDDIAGQIRTRLEGFDRHDGPEGNGDPAAPAAPQAATP